MLALRSDCSYKGGRFALNNRREQLSPLSGAGLVSYSKRWVAVYSPQTSDNLSRAEIRDADRVFLAEEIRGAEQQSLFFSLREEEEMMGTARLSAGGPTRVDNLGRGGGLPVRKTGCRVAGRPKVRPKKKQNPSQPSHSGCVERRHVETAVPFSGALRPRSDLGPGPLG